jgi:hypothetical protein
MGLVAGHRFSDTEVLRKSLSLAKSIAPFKRLEIAF